MTVSIYPAYQDPTPCFQPENHFVYGGLKNLIRVSKLARMGCTLCGLPETFSFPLEVVPSALLIL